MREPERVRKIFISVLCGGLERNNFNRFNGGHIEKILSKGFSLFRDVGVKEEADIEKGYFDTIYLYPVCDCDDRRDVCEIVGWALGADEVGWRKDQNGKTVLRCWWD